MGNVNKDDGRDLGWRGGLPQNQVETGLNNYRLIYPRLAATNRKLWNRVILADQTAIRLERDFYDGRLELVSVEDEPFLRTLKLLRAYLQARSCLGYRNGPLEEGELEWTMNPAMLAAEQHAALEAYKSMQEENEVLHKVAWVGHWLRTDPLAMVVWYQEAGSE